MGRLEIELHALAVGEEQLQAVHLVGRDGVLAVLRQNPIDEGLTFGLLDLGAFLRIDQDDAVLVEQLLVAFDVDFVIALVLEADPNYDCL